MPQVDLETFVSACAGGVSGDRKIACETQADGDGGQPPEAEDQPQPDLPPESFWLSKDAEYDWFDRNAFYERKESTKGNSNSNTNTNSANLNPAINPASNSNSQRFPMNLKSKASIIGLPKTQNTTYVDTTKRRNYKPPNIQLFPKRSGSIGKSAEAEPSSPKVSCMGRVRSKRGRRKPVNEVEKLEENARTAGCGICMAMFRSNRRSRPGVNSSEPVPATESPPRKSVTVKAREIEQEAAGEPPGLGGMMRFASGRRSASWGVDDVEGGPAGRS